MAETKEPQETPTKVKPTDIGRFLNFVAGMFCGYAQKEHKKAKDMGPNMEMAVAFGLLLAKNQPELVDACYQYWQYTRQMKPEELVDETVSMHKAFLQTLEESE